MIRHALPVLAVLALAAVAHADDAAPDSGLVVLPPIVDLGIVEPGAKTTVTAWLVNASLAPIDVVSCKPGCGCTVVDRFPQRLEPGSALPVTYTIAAGTKPDTPKSATIRLTPGWGAPVTLTTKLRTASPTLARAARSDGAATPPVRADEDAAQLLAVIDDLGEIRAGRPFDTTAWIVNPTRHTVRVDRVKAGCGCTKVVGFAPVDVAPDSAARLRLRITPSAKKIGAKTVTLTAHLAGEPTPLTTALRMSVVEAADTEPLRVSGR